MKKVLSIILILITICLTGSVYATELVKTSTLQLEIINNEKEEDIKIYMLLSKEYIEEVLNQENIKYDYDGANTLKYNSIYSIEVEPQYVQDQVYEENNTEYVQILLESNSKGLYQFNVLSNFLTNESIVNNIMYRIKDGGNDFIAHLSEKFKANKNNVYEIQYNHSNFAIKQPDESVISFATIFFVILLILIVIIGIISYGKQRRY